jgi:ankyrin repeat protein
MNRRISSRLGFASVILGTLAVGCGGPATSDSGKTTSMDSIEQYERFESLLESNDLEGFMSLIEQYPDLLVANSLVSPSLLNDAVAAGNMEFVKVFLSRGFSVAENPKGKKLFLMNSAVRAEQFEMARWLLQQGCDPNRGRLLIGAINRPENALEWVKLFVEHGADVNWCVRIAGPEEEWATPLDWARRARKQVIVDFLLSKGAVTADDPHTNRRTGD